MKPILFISLLFIPFCAQAQNINFQDSFSDQTFRGWIGDTTDFGFVREGHNILLALDADSAGSSYLSTPSASVHGSWEFFIRLNFSPSRNNRLQVYLMSDRANLKGKVNGYVLQAGENLSEDVFRLFSVTDGIPEEEVLTGLRDISQGGDYRIKIHRDSAGHWELWSGKGYSGKLEFQDSARHNYYQSASYLGFMAEYTRSNTQNIALDFRIDVAPLRVDSIRAVSPLHLKLFFSRPVLFESVGLRNFKAGPENITPSSLEIESEYSLSLHFEDSLVSGPKELIITGIEDASGDNGLIKQTAQYVLFDGSRPGDILINEFMKDPPEGGSEYVELYNHSPRYLNLKNWILGDNRNLHTLSDSVLAMEPGAFRVLGRDTLMQEIYGIPDDIFIPFPLPALNNNRDDIRLFNEQGEIQDSLSYSETWGGVHRSLERVSARAPSGFQENWMESLHPTGGTPGVPNSLPQDLIPPDISDIQPSDSLNIRVIYSERVLSPGAEAPDGYAIEALPELKPVSIQAIQHLNRDTVLIRLEKALAEGTYNLRVNGISDIFGNIQRGSSREFEYIPVSLAAYENVLINEFMFRPPVYYSEFVELYNPTSRNYNLKNWTFNDQTGSRRLLSKKDLILKAGSYLVLTPDSLLIDQFDCSTCHVLSMPALNNSEDALVLRNAQGLLIDSLHYTSEWGGDEISLERKSLKVRAYHYENWGESPGGPEGSPGFENSIPADTKPPEILEASASDPRQIRIIFDESLGVSKPNPGPFLNLIPYRKIESILQAKNELHIYLDQNLEDNTTYEIQIPALSDLFGNTTENISTEFRYLQFSDPKPKKVVLNEILYRSGDLTPPEFVELYNPGPFHFNLDNWVLKDSGNESAVIPAGTLLAAGEYLVIGGESFPASLNPPDHYIGLPDLPALNNLSDQIILKSAEGLTIDSLEYRDEWFNLQTGHSIERKDPHSPSEDPANWEVTSSGIGHSAGMQNTVFEIDQTPPIPIFANYLHNYIEVHFNEFIKLRKNYRFESKAGNLSVIQYDSTHADHLLLKYPDSFSPPDALKIYELSDFRNNTTASFQIPVSRPIEKGNLVINEILFDPLADPSDHLPDQAEYIELYNRSGHAVSLEGIRLHDGPDENGMFRFTSPISSDKFWIPENEYALFYTGEESTPFNESLIGHYFQVSAGQWQPLFQVQKSSLGLHSETDIIVLADSTGQTIDSVIYHTGWHNPDIYQTKGISLERINPFIQSSGSRNWSSSVHPKGGTPLKVNSIYQDFAYSDKENSIALHPNPFSPDGDGYEDHLFISYRLNHPDYKYRIRIFDRFGRMVRFLVNNQPAGFEGSVIWDGFTEDRNRNRVGFYIILFEAFNSSLGKKQVFRKTAVLARKF